MSSTNGIALTFSRPTDFHREAEWDEWYEEVHLPETVGDASGAWVATRFETLERGPLYSSPIGFTHMTVHEFADIERDGPRFVALIRELTARRALHPLHTIIGLDVFEAVGEWSAKPEPSAALTGHVFAFTMCNDPAAEAEWNEWYDTVHVPDMMASDAFAATTRWVRLAPHEFGPNHLTLYDVATDDIGAAVVKSGAVMPGLHEAGRLHEGHAGGLRAALRSVGPHAGVGCRAPGGRAAGAA